jgi:hypothetical protein
MAGRARRKFPSCQPAEAPALIHENTSLLFWFSCVIAISGVSAGRNPLFQANAVLPCDARVPVWGTAREGEKVTVTFAGQEISTDATNGVWQVWLQQMKASANHCGASAGSDIGGPLACGRGQFYRDFGLFAASL